MEHTCKRFFHFIVIILLTFSLILGGSATGPERDCTCVPYYQCTNDSGELIIDGQGLLDLRQLDSSACQGDFDVCCNITKAALFPTTEEPQKSVGCGFQTSGYFPWYAALSFQEIENFPPVYKCGVSLIHPKAVLTAAHCFNKDGIWSVQIGSIFRQISKTIIHPKYNPITMQNDIALAVLAEPIEIDGKINTICIAPQGTTLDNAECRVTARLKDIKEGAYLKMLEVPIVPRQICANMLRSTRLGPFFQLHASFLCAGGAKQKNTCVGDGGSPLVCPISGQPDRYHQAGIVSWGIGCGDNDVPDVYVKLSMFRDWIDMEMISNGLDITSYRY